MGVVTEVAVICCLLGPCRGYSVRAIGSSYVPVIGRANDAGLATGNKTILPVVNTDADWSDRVGAANQCTEGAKLISPVSSRVYSAQAAQRAHWAERQIAEFGNWLNLNPA